MSFPLPKQKLNLRRLEALLFGYQINNTINQTAFLLLRKAPPNNIYSTKKQISIDQDKTKMVDTAF